MSNTTYDAIEDRRRRINISHEDLAQRARVPYTRLYFVLAGKIKPDELQRLERVLQAAENEHGS